MHFFKLLGLVLAVEFAGALVIPRVAQPGVNDVECIECGFEVLYEREPELQPRTDCIECGFEVLYKREPGPEPETECIECGFEVLY